MPPPAELLTVQRFLIGALRAEAPIPDDPVASDATRAHVAGNDRLSPAEQTDLYREQFWLRHLDSLIEDYPGLRALVGESVFDALMRAYLSAHPPRTPSLRELGADLGPFAARWGGFAAEVRDAALEMLTYEQRFIDLFDGADPPPLNAAKLQGLGEDAWDRARIVLHPLLARMHLAHPMHLFRLAALEAPDAAPPFPEKRPVSLVLYRQDLVIRYDEIDPEALGLLDALANCEPLAPACERVASTLAPEEADAFAAKVGAWFQDWTTKGWIVDVIV